MKKSSKTVVPVLLPLKNSPPNIKAKSSREQREKLVRAEGGGHTVSIVSTTCDVFRVATISSIFAYKIYDFQVKISKH